MELKEHQEDPVHPEIPALRVILALVAHRVLQASQELVELKAMKVNVVFPERWEPRAIEETMVKRETVVQWEIVDQVDHQEFLESKDLKEQRGLKVPGEKREPWVHQVIKENKVFKDSLVILALLVRRVTRERLEWREMSVLKVIG